MFANRRHQFWKWLSKVFKTKPRQFEDRTSALRIMLTQLAPGFDTHLRGGFTMTTLRLRVVFDPHPALALLPADAEGVPAAQEVWRWYRMCWASVQVPTQADGLCVGVPSFSKQASVCRRVGDLQQYLLDMLLSAPELPATSHVTLLLDGVPLPSDGPMDLLRDADTVR